VENTTNVFVYVSLYCKCRTAVSPAQLSFEWVWRVNMPGFEPDNLPPSCEGD